MRLKRALRSLFVGIALAGLQLVLLLYARPLDPQWFISGAYRASLFLAMPGMIVAVLAPGGNFHLFSPYIAVVANLIFYSLVAYLFMSLWAKFSPAFKGRGHP